MTTYTLESDHPDAARLIRRALENYAGMAQTSAVRMRHGKPNPGESPARREAAARVWDQRAEAAAAMAGQMPGGEITPPKTGH